MPQRNCPWKSGLPANVEAKESCPSHHIAEILTGEAKSDPDDSRRQDQQQEAERRSLLPVEARDELRVDLLGEPQRVLAAQQSRRQVIAKREHEYNDAACSDTRRGMRQDEEVSQWPDSRPVQQLRALG